MTATISFSTVSSFPLLILTTVALAFLFDICKNFLDADHRVGLLLRSSFASTSSGRDGRNGKDTTGAAVDTAWSVNGAPESRFNISRRSGLPVELSHLRVEAVRLWWELVRRIGVPGIGLTWEGRRCFTPTFTGGSDTSSITTSPHLPKVTSGIDTERGIPVLIPGGGPLGTGGKAGTGGIRALTERGGTTHAGIGGTGGASVSPGNGTTNGVIKENMSEILFEFLHSTGDLIAMMLEGEKGGLLKTIGEAGADGTGLIGFCFGNIVIPHLLGRRTGGGLSRAGVSGELGLDGEGEGSGRIATSADSS